MKNKRQQRKQLYNTAKKYVDIKALFPKSKNVGKSGLTDYQQKKISRALRHIVAQAGGLNYLEKDFIPVKRTKAAREYLEKAGLKYAKGVILSGGAAKNEDVHFSKGEIIYTRGGRETRQYPIDARSEMTISKDIRRARKSINNPNNSAYLVTAGGKINNAYIKQRGRYIRYDMATTGELSESDIIEEAAIQLFNKYAGMSISGEKRENGRRAAHPSRWGMAILIEAK